MVKINPTVTLELRDGQRITINVEEAGQIIRGLRKFVQDSEYGGAPAAMEAPTRVQKKRGPKTARKANRTYMSEIKKAAILQHIEKQLSKRPRTISNLLKGISYVPNHLPDIRRMIESQRNVSKKKVGKRTLYYRG